MSTMNEQFLTHQQPVWQDRSNFIINAELPERDGRFEQLWARQLSDDTFEVCCIPFFLSDVALGDVVQTEPAGERRYVVARVVQPSGRYVFRVWFGETAYPRDEIARRLETLGALLEWSSVNLLAVDARDEHHAQEIADYLSGAEGRGELIYETGRST
jgi:hypothetical protein